VSKIIVKHNGTPIAEVSFDISVFGNISARQAVQLMASAPMTLEVTEADKVEFITATNFACGILQLLRSEKTRCELPNTSATPG
jgi:hypothetical protein